MRSYQVSVPTTTGSYEIGRLYNQDPPYNSGMSPLLGSEFFRVSEVWVTSLKTSSIMYDVALNNFTTTEVFPNISNRVSTTHMQPSLTFKATENGYVSFIVTVPENVSSCSITIETSANNFETILPLPSSPGDSGNRFGIEAMSSLTVACVAKLWGDTSVNISKTTLATYTDRFAGIVVYSPSYTGCRVTPFIYNQGTVYNGDGEGLTVTTDDGLTFSVTPASPIAVFIFG